MRNYSGVDIALLCGNERCEVGEELHFLFPEAAQPVCTPAYLAAHGPFEDAADLNRANLLHLHERHRSADAIGWQPLGWEEWFRAQGAHWEKGPFSLSSNKVALLIEATLSGEGIMLGWQHMVRRYLDDGQLVPAHPAPITGITKTVLESGGFTVEVEEFPEWGIAFAALTKGDIDIMASQTDYGAHDFWTRNMDKLEKISPVSHGLYQAIAVPNYAGIISMDERAANADKFGDKILGIEPGSALMRDAAAAVDAYGTGMTLVEGSTASMTAALDAAMSRNEWIAVTVWEPSWMMQKYDIRFLKDPKGVFPGPQSCYWIGTAGFSGANPAAREAIASVHVPLADITAISGAMNDGKTMEQAVADWTAANADLIARWTAIRSQ